MVLGITAHWFIDGGGQRGSGNYATKNNPIVLVPMDGRGKNIQGIKKQIADIVFEKLPVSGFVTLLWAFGFRILAAFG